MSVNNLYMIYFPLSSCTFFVISSMELWNPAARISKPQLNLERSYDAGMSNRWNTFCLCRLNHRLASVYPKERIGLCLVVRTGTCSSSLHTFWHQANPFGPPCFRLDVIDPSSLDWWERNKRLLLATRSHYSIITKQSCPNFTPVPSRESAKLL